MSCHGTDSRPIKSDANSKVGSGACYCNQCCVSRSCLILLTGNVILALLKINLLNLVYFIDPKLEV